MEIYNRLAKNLRNLRPWLAAKKIHCYRLYDRDLPDYAFSVDVWGSEEGLSFLLVQEYLRPRELPRNKAESRLQAGVDALGQLFEIGQEKIFVKSRQAGPGGGKYGRLDNQKRLISVEEGGLSFLVNPSDYHDTGLFLDHRPMRRIITAQARGKSLLNLFCYTASITAAAAAGGAEASLSVDMSNTYLAWGRQNLVQNGLMDSRHVFCRADCLSWLEGEGPRLGRRFDIIFVDPPSFSNSKKMTGSFAVQRDHPRLLSLLADFMHGESVLYFSTNKRGFRFEKDLEKFYSWQDISPQTIDPDFKRNPGIHQVYLLKKTKQQGSRE